MKFNLLTLTLHNFIAAFSGGATRVSSAANAVLASLIVIDVVLLGMWWSLDGGERLSAMFKKLLFIGFWIWAVKSFPSLSKSFVDSLVSAGQMAGGGPSDSSLLLDPSRIAGYGLDATEPLAKKIEDLHITEFADGIVYGISYLAIMACFLIMAIHVFLAVLEYYLIVAVVGVLMPFGLLPSTKFLAEKAIGAVVAAGIKLMVMSFLLAAIEPVLANSMKFSSEDVPMNELFAMFLTACALMLLTWKTPNLASTLIAGHPNLGAGDATAPVAAVGGVALGMATAGASYLATKAATSTDGPSFGGGRSNSSQGSFSAANRFSSNESPRQGAGQKPAPTSPSTASTKASPTLVMSSQGQPEQSPPTRTALVIPARGPNDLMVLPPISKTSNATHGGHDGNKNKVDT